MIEKFSEIAMIVAIMSNLQIDHGYDTDSINREQLHCLAQNVYRESAGENNYGKLAVANVTKNRVQSDNYPDTYCSVVWETRRSSRTGKQVPMFSWTLDGKPDSIPLTVNGKPHKTNIDVWTRSIVISALVVIDELHDITCGSTHYYAHNKVNPAWANSDQFEKACVPGGKIGNHTFLRVSQK